MIKKTISSIIFLAICSTPLIASAQRPGDHGDHYVHHPEWKRGYHMSPDNWNRGERIDYRQHHLAPPRRGYEWREVDGNYVEAAIATGVIASVVAASAAH